MNYSFSFHKLMLGIAVALCAFAPASASIIVDDTFDDGVLSTNTMGIGNGFNSQVLATGTVANEVGGNANIIIPTNGGRRGEIVSVDAAAVNNSLGSSFEFVDVNLSQNLQNQLSGASNRILFGVQGSSAANANSLGNQDPGLWLAIGSNSPTNGGGFGSESVLFFEAADDTRQILAEFEFDTLSIDPSVPFDFSPTLGFDFVLTDTTYSLAITGDTVTVNSGSLSGTVAHGLTNGFAAFGGQNENPGVDISVGQIVVTEIAVPEPSSLVLLGLGGIALLNTRKRKLA